MTTLSTMVAVTGVVVIIATVRGVIPEQRPQSTLSTGLWVRTVDKIRALPQRLWITMGVSGGLGALLAWLTGWPTLIVIVPAATVGLPALLADPPNTTIQLLEDVDRWVRTMIGAMSTGKSIIDAIRLSVRQAPPRLSSHLSRLVRRLDDRWPPQQALLAMADDIASPEVDAVLAALMLSIERGGAGATATLHALADSIHDQLRALRDIEAERAKPRAVVRQVTLITVVVLSLGFLTARDFFAPYGTPLGQVILGVLLASYGAALVVLRRMTIPRQRARILRSAP